MIKKAGRIGKGLKSKKLAAVVTLALALGMCGLTEASSGLVKADDLTTNNKVYFGTYLQDRIGKEYRFSDSSYRKQGVLYSVVHKNTDDGHLVLYSDKCLTTSWAKGAGWSDNAINKQLNDDGKDSFLKKSFTTSEQNVIPDSTITTHLAIKQEEFDLITEEGWKDLYKAVKTLVHGLKHSFDGDFTDAFGFKGGDEVTTQKIYIPSYQEIKDYNLDKDALKTGLSDYAYHGEANPIKTLLVWTGEGKGHTQWYLRSFGVLGPQIVLYDGKIFTAGNIFVNEGVGAELLEKLVSHIPEAGDIIELGWDIAEADSNFGVKPALQLDPATILYTSDASTKTGGKNAASVGGGFISPSKVTDDSTVKLTIKDYYDASSNTEGQQALGNITVTNTAKLGMIYQL